MTPLFSEMMRAARVARGWTLTQVAEKIGHHPSFVSLVERGLRRIDEAGVLRIAEVLRLDPANALLAALRERLPEERRSVLPETFAAIDDAERHAGARELQRKHFDFQVDRLRVDLAADWDGNVRKVRSFEGCTPARAGRTVWEIVFQERIVGAPPPEGAPEPKIALRQAPDGLEHEVRSTIRGDWRIHVLAFPRGWRRESGAAADATLSFALETYLPGALALDASVAVARGTREGLHSPLLDAYNYYLVHLVKRLEIAVEFPPRYAPEKWDAWTWWGPGSLESATENLGAAGICRSLEMRADGARAELLVDAPLAGYSYSVVWLPASRRECLEARYGGSDAET